MQDFAAGGKSKRIVSHTRTCKALALVEPGEPSEGDRGHRKVGKMAVTSFPLQPAA